MMLIIRGTPLRQTIKLAFRRLFENIGVDSAGYLEAMIDVDLAFRRGTVARGDSDP